MCKKCLEKNDNPVFCLHSAISAVPAGKSVCKIHACVSQSAAAHGYCCLDTRLAITHDGSFPVKTLSFGISVDLWIF